MDERLEMLTCNDAEAAVAREADGTLLEAERQALEAHVAGCQPCATLRAGQREVRTMVAGRPPAKLPPRFLDRVMAQIEEEKASWLPPLDWRRWTEWSVPVAAALMLVAAIAGQPASQQATTTEGAGVIELWAEGGEPASSPAATVLSDEASTEEMLASLLSVGTPSSGEAR